MFTSCFKYAQPDGVGNLIKIRQRVASDPDLPDPWWTDGNPIYRILLIDDLGFRAFTVEVGQQPTERAPICEGP